MRPVDVATTWVSGVSAVIVPVVYFAVMLGRLQDTSAADIAYQVPLIVAIVASVVLTIVGAIAAAVGTGISAELRGRKAQDEIDRKDECDKSMARHGDLVGFYVSSAGLVGALILTMPRPDAAAGPRRARARRRPLGGEAPGRRGGRRAPRRDGR